MEEKDELQKIEVCKNGFRKYGKIHRLGKEETDGILFGNCRIQEKVDGANTSIWWDAESNWIRCASRSKEVKEGFNGFVDYVHKHEGIASLLKDKPSYRLYGEWLVRHTIQYKETAYRKWYMFDIYDSELEKYIGSEGVDALGQMYNIETVPYHGCLVDPTMEQLNEFVGKTSFGDRGEGIVIKNPNFVNKFGDVQYAKIVTDSFKEDNAVAFGGNNKHSDSYWEVYIVNKYMTLPRIQKIMGKIQPEIEGRLDMKHIPRIMGTAFHDIITEEAWEIAKLNAKIDFKTLKRISDKKSKQIYVDILNDTISVADRKN